MLNTKTWSKTVHTVANSLLKITFIHYPLFSPPVVLWQKIEFCLAQKICTDSLQEEFRYQNSQILKKSSNYIQKNIFLSECNLSTGKWEETRRINLFPKERYFFQISIHKMKKSCITCVVVSLFSQLLILSSNGFLYGENDILCVMTMWSSRSCDVSSEDRRM